MAMTACLEASTISVCTYAHNRLCTHSRTSIHSFDHCMYIHMISRTCAHSHIDFPLTNVRARTYTGRLLLVTTVPMAVVLFFSTPWLASFFYMRHRRSRVFAQFSNSSLWIIYLIYPLLCFMTIQGFKVCPSPPLRLAALSELSHNLATDADVVSVTVSLSASLNHITCFPLCLPQCHLRFSVKA